MLPYPKFLYGDKLSVTSIGASINYEVMHNLFGQSSFRYSITLDENILRTPAYQHGKTSGIGLSFGYGF